MQLLIETVEKSHPIIGQIRELKGESLYAQIVDGSAETDPAVWIDASGGARRVVVRCSDPVHADTSVSDEDRLLASWSPAGWTRFDEQLARLDQLAGERGIELMIRPSAAGMLSDAICTCSWARRSESLGCSLLLDPMGWIVPSMMGDIEDHLERIAGLSGGCPKVGAVLVRSLRRDNSGSLVETTLADGDIDPDLIVSTLGELVRSAPVVVGLDPADLARF